MLPAMRRNDGRCARHVTRAARRSRDLDEQREAREGLPVRGHKSSETLTRSRPGSTGAARRRSPARHKSSETLTRSRQDRQVRRDVGAQRVTRAARRSRDLDNVDIWVAVMRSNVTRAARRSRDLDLRCTPYPSLEYARHKSSETLTRSRLSRSHNSSETLTRSRLGGLDGVVPATLGHKGIATPKSSRRRHNYTGFRCVGG